jgi:hypothetical protein
MKSLTIGAVALVVLPMCTRAIQALRHRALLKNALTDDQAARDSSRTVIVALAGFSFTGVAGVAVLESATRRQELQVPVAFFLLSFLFSIFALQLENYKFRWSRLILSMYLIESALLMLLIAIVAIVFSGQYSHAFRALVAGVSFAGWLLDHILEWRYSENHLQQLEKKNADRNG